MKRIALVGMNNPQSHRPEHVLWPEPEGCTGNRLWQMTAARTGATKQDYLKAFHRYNLVPGIRWDAEYAARTWELDYRALFNNFDRVVLLGRAVLQVTGLRLPGLFVSEDIITIPHPSSLNRWYNEERNRQIVEVIMEELYAEAVGL